MPASRTMPRFFTAVALASALCVPAAALAAQFDYYIKLPPIEGDSGKGARHGGEIEIQSFSWGATQTSQGSGGGGVGAGKANIQDISAPSATSGKGEKGGTEDINIGVGELQESGEAEITLKGSKIRENAPAAEPAASGLPTGKRQHKPLTLARPLAAGSVIVRGKLPGCTIGTRYPSLELGARGRRFTLHDVVVTSCGGSGGDSLPMEEISFNYGRIKT